MIHIEFSGVPGSGKTFLCTRIAEELRLQGVPVITNPFDLAEKPVWYRAFRKSSTILLQVLRHPVWTSYVLSTIVTSRQSSIKGFLRSFFTITQVSGIIQKHRNQKVCLMLDQGSVQAFFTVLYGSTMSPKGSIERILPKPDILLETDSTDAVILSRLSARTRVQSRVESSGLAGIQRSRDILAVIRQSVLYTTIRSKIAVPDERTDTVLRDITQELKKRIINDTQQ